METLRFKLPLGLFTVAVVLALTYAYHTHCNDEGASWWTVTSESGLVYQSSQRPLRTPDGSLRVVEPNGEAHYLPGKVKVVRQTQD